MAEHQPVSQYPQNVEQALGAAPQGYGPTGSATDSQAKLVEFLVKDTSIPKRLRKEEMWGFADKEMALSQLTGKDIDRVLTSLEVVHTLKQAARPDYDNSWEDEIDFRQLKAKVFVKLKRSEEGFERRIQATQVHESYYGERLGQQGGPGLLQRIKGGLGAITGR